MQSVIKLGSTRRITSDDNHNGFTDLVGFKDDIYLAFRSSPSGPGVSVDSSVRILRSDDGVAWTEVHRFELDGRDLRGAHFLSFGGTLFVYSGSADTAAPSGGDPSDLNNRIGYMVSSNDGLNWTDPVGLESTRGHDIWGSTSFGDRAYLSGRRKNGLVSMPYEKSEWAIQQSILLESRDGIEFVKLARFQPSYGDETAFLFEESGEVAALVRCRDPEQPAFICRSEPPFAEWERVQIDSNVRSPMLARWANFWIAGGGFGPASAPQSKLRWLEEDRLVDAIELPGGGEGSCPSFLELDPSRAIVSYSSSHEGGGRYPGSVYIAELTLE